MPCKVPEAQQPAQRGCSPEKWMDGGAFRFPDLMTRIFMEQENNLKTAYFSMAGVALTTLVGCTTVYEGKYEFNSGWREGVIQKIGSASDIATPQFSDCRANMLPQQRATTRFALVAYRRMGRTQRNVVPLLPNDLSTAGQAVYMNVVDCNAPLVARP